MNLPYISAPVEITNNDYHNGERYREFVSSSDLKKIQVSPLWLKYCKEHPEEDEDVKAWSLEGGCYHDMLSSITNTGGMDEFDRNTAVFEPPVNPSTGNPYGYNTQKFQDAYNFFLSQNAGKTVYSEIEVENAKTMIETLRNGNKHLSKIVNKLLSIGKAEVSFFCQHSANDLIQYDSGLLKIRPDLFTFNKIIDWKTVTRINGEAPLKQDQFAKVISKYGYGFSAAMYQYVTWMITGHWKAFYWVVQDKLPPYDYNIISADQWAFEVSNGQMIGIGKHAEIFLKSLEQYLYCHEKNEWPGVSIFTKPDYRGQRIAQCKVPGYEYTKEYEFFN